MRAVALFLSGIGVGIFLHDSVVTIMRAITYWFLTATG
jgi:hypothetical protein